VTIFVISGPGGAGKGTIVDQLCREDAQLWLSRSWTTRARRPSENPYAYRFVDRETFEAKIAKEGFLEWVEFLGNYYGTPLPSAPEGNDVLFEIEVQGAQAVKQKYPDAVLIFIEPPSRQHQEDRLRSRGDTEENIAKRLRKAEAEEAVGHEIADHIVINDTLERTVAEVAGIVSGYRGSDGA
jgi:guanylate kinase